MPDPAQPSAANVATACAIIGLVTGYLIGQAKSLGLFGGSPISGPPSHNEQAIDSDESSDEDDSAPNEFPGHSEECKLVLVVRTDLGMTKGNLQLPRLTIGLVLTAQRRQNRCPVRPCDARVLQAVSPAIT